MTELFKNKYRSGSTRKPDWDYTNPGKYFVTICTKNRFCWFGHVKEGQMELSEIGKIIFEEWQKTPDIRPNVRLDEFVIMPNHLHGIVIITRKISVGTTRRVVPTLPPNSLGSIIGQFKSVCTKRIRKMGFVEFSWQPRFYDHIIRNGQEFVRVKNYIRKNPAKWQNDNFHWECTKI